MVTSCGSFARAVGVALSDVKIANVVDALMLLIFEFRGKNVAVVTGAQSIGTVPRQGEHRRETDEGVRGRICSECWT